MKIERLKTDLLIIGGGTAGCYAAITAAGAGLKILVVEKANIKRSGCLAAGVNALNAYITEGRTPRDYVEYAKKDDIGAIYGEGKTTAVDNEELIKVNKNIRQHPVEEVGAWLRDRMSGMTKVV